MVPEAMSRGMVSIPSPNEGTKGCLIDNVMMSYGTESINKADAAGRSSTVAISFQPSPYWFRALRD